MAWQDRLPWAARNGHAALDDRPALVQRLRETEDTLALVQEDTASLRAELALDDLGWLPLGPYESWELSRDQLRRARARSRAMYLRSPLINYAVDLQAVYVFGQGVSFVATDPRVQAIIDAFLDDPANQTELTSHEARLMKERELQIDGDLFFVLFTDRQGAVRVRTIPPNEISAILTNPEDAKEPWYYKREWTQQTTNLTSGLPETAVRTVYYPDWRYQPEGTRQPTIGQQRVEWETPIYHRKVGGFSDMLFGVPETYSAHDWVLAHKKNLEDWASIVEALRKFAYQVKTPGGARGVQALKAKLGTTFGTSGTGAETNPPPTTASTAIMNTGYTLEPVRTQGATASPEDSRQLRLMVSAGVAIPDHFFDADVGNFATAKTLARPTELKFRNRQTLWADTFDDLFQYVIDRKLDANNGSLGPLPPTAGDQVQATTPDELDRTVDSQFPPILERDLGELVTAVVQTITLAGHPPYSDALLRELMPYILNALGEDDVDAKLAELFPETEPTPEDQAGEPTATGDYAGADPAAAVPGVASV